MSLFPQTVTVQWGAAAEKKMHYQVATGLLSLTIRREVFFNTVIEDNLS